MVSSFWPSIGIFGDAPAAGSESWTGDPYWDLTDICCNFGGSDGSTTITEEKSGSTFTSVQQYTPAGYGLPVISTADSKSGGSSLKFRGGAWTYISLPNTGINQDFTLEWWDKIATHPGSTTTATAQVAISGSGAGNSPRVTYTNLNVATGIPMSSATPATSWSNSTWTHWAVVGIGRSGRLYKNGQMVSTAFNNTAQPFYNTITTHNLFTIGNNNGALTPTSNGCLTTDTFIDMVRYTRGLARYVGNFTPPSTPHKTGSYGTITAIDVSAATVQGVSGSQIDVAGLLTDDSNTTGFRSQTDSFNPKVCVVDLGFDALVTEVRIMNGNGTVFGSTVSDFNAAALQGSYIAYNTTSGLYYDSGWQPCVDMRSINWVAAGALTGYRWIRLPINGGLGVRARYWKMDTNNPGSTTRLVLSGWRFYTVV